MAFDRLSSSNASHHRQNATRCLARAWRRARCRSTPSMWRHDSEQNFAQGGRFSIGALQRRHVRDGTTGERTPGRASPLIRRPTFLPLHRRLSAQSAGRVRYPRDAACSAPAPAQGVVRDRLRRGRCGGASSSSVVADTSTASETRWRYVRASIVTLACPSWSATRASGTSSSTAYEPTVCRSSWNTASTLARLHRPRPSAS